MKTAITVAVFIFFGGTFWSPPAITAQPFETPNERMRQMAGKEIFFGDDLLARAHQLAPGEKFTIDEDGDGDPDVTIFNDNDPKHTIQPIFVKVIDEDDDQGEDGYGDTDSDCWIADWYGDAVIDCVIDYEDRDGDNDVDRMTLYDKDFYGRTAAIVCDDIGDDNRLWYTRNYTYDQPGCQWFSDFNGDELFCMFDFDPQTGQLFPKFENPFVFYDMDNDECSEIVIRFSGEDLYINRLRYSYDMDNDAEPGNPHDYDFSFNCEGHARIPDESLTKPEFRHAPARHGYIRWEDGPEVAQSMDWDKNVFIWDEADNTANPTDIIQRLHERWEGVGGYRMPRCNFRREYDEDFSGGLKLYWCQVDRRVHLFGAEYGELFVDYDFDGDADMAYRCEDTDKDGYFDRWRMDHDADGDYEQDYKNLSLQYEDLPLDYESLHKIYIEKLDEAILANEQVIAAIKDLIGDQRATPMERWYNDAMWGNYHAAVKLATSKEAKRYYQDLSRVYLFRRLLEHLSDNNEILSAEELDTYTRGDYREFAAILEMRNNRK